MRRARAGIMRDLVTRVLLRCQTLPPSRARVPSSRFEVRSPRLSALREHSPLPLGFPLALGTSARLSVGTRHSSVLACRAMERDEWLGVGQAIAATAFFSMGTILVRLAAGLSPFEVTWLRMLLAAPLVAGAARLAGHPVRLTSREVRRLVPIGAVAALHFLTFIASLY